jgi:N utilization substance protein A
VREVYIDDETREATVVVPDDQLALAIGKEGLNARLATRLTGWKIDIQSESEFARAEADAAFAGAVDDEDSSGRCAAILSNGKRCPNAAEPGSRYCGVPAHQALASSEPAATATVEAVSEEASVEEQPGNGNEPELAEAAVTAEPGEPPVAADVPDEADDEAPSTEAL